MQTSYLMRIWVDVEDDGELRSPEALTAEASMIESKLKVGKVMGMTYPVNYACVEIDRACTHCEGAAYECGATECSICRDYHCNGKLHAAE